MLIGTEGDALIVEVVPVMDRMAAFRVVSQDDARIAHGTFEFMASNGMQLQAVSNPYPHESTLYIRGECRDLDAAECSISFKSAAKRDEWIARVTQAVSELNKSLRPKRKVQIERWVNVYPNGGMNTYEIEEIANRFYDGHPIACVRLTGEYEVDA